MSVKNKVEEISLRPYEYMLPIFEIIVNSIISVAQKHKSGGGLINIKIERDSSVDSSKSLGLFAGQNLETRDKKVAPMPIKSVLVTDNGLGFNTDNFKSFITAYSETHKDKGCKGVGRFTVLSCFHKMEVESVYNENQKQYRRKFVFDIEDEVQPEVDNFVQLDSTTKSETKVHAIGFKDKFKDRTSVTTQVIAESIIEHCLLFLTGKNAPTIILDDNYENSNIILNDVLNSVIQLDGKPKTFKIIDSEPDFKLAIIKRYDAPNRTHKLKFCANSRVVGKSINIATLINGFESPIPGDDGNSFFIDVYVTSNYFDEKVNTVRNRLNIPELPEDDSLLKEITIAGVEQKVIELLEDKYRKNIAVIHAKNFEKIKQYILDPKKMRLTYRSLLKRPDLLKQIPSNASEDTIEEHLHRIKFHIEKDLNRSIRKALKRGKPEDYEEYSKILSNVINQEAKLSKDKLADLLIRRSSIISLFKKLYKLGKDGDYNYEKDLHNLIFPMGESNDSIPYEYHNLWLLDERLAFHSYVASDIKFRTNEVLSNQSNKEGDLLIFDFPWAFSGQESKMNSIVLFEFKRPGRDMNTVEDKKLDKQLMTYFENLMESKAKNYHGEYINLEITTPKFGYIVCDLHKDLMNYNINFNGFRSTPHKTLYKLNDVINLHIEALSYQQLAEMSEKRHAAFFKELGLQDIDD